MRFMIVLKDVYSCLFVLICCTAFSYFVRSEFSD